MVNVVNCSGERSRAGDNIGEGGGLGLGRGPRDHRRVELKTVPRRLVLPRIIVIVR